MMKTQIERVESLTDEVSEHRSSAYDILPILMNRWSPRAMTGEPMSDEEILPLFEAARWAPSSYNAQPWRFIIARRQDPAAFKRLFDLMVPANQAWAKDAAVLVVIVSRKLFERNEKPAPTHAFDAGAAWENLALEAASRGLVAHGMQGFDYHRAHTVLAIPDEFEVNAMVAIGKRGPKETLPEDKQAIEQPNQRRPLSEIIFNGEFGTPLPGIK